MLFRSSINRSLFRTLRDEFDRYPNLHLDEPVALGQVGVIDNAAGNFEWRTSLDTLGVKAPLLPGGPTPAIVNTAYTTGANTRCDFTLDAAGLGAADFDFQSQRSLATQALGMRTERYDIGLLEAALNAHIHAGNTWNRDWVIVTQIHPAEAYTLLFSRSTDVEARIATQVPVSSPAFNIADPQLGLALTRSSGALYSVLAQADVVPYFRIHKLKGWRGAGEGQKLTLAPYGRG